MEEKVFGRTKKQAPEEPLRRQPISRSEPRPAFSYYANRSVDRGDVRRVDRSEGLQPRPRRNPKRLLGKLPYLLLLALVIVCGVKMLSLSNQPRVIVVGQGTDASYVQTAGLYADATHKLLATSSLNHFKLTADFNGVSSQLQRQFPELETVSITAPFIGNKPIVYVMPASPGVLLQTSDGGTYAVNASGVVLAEITGNTSLPGVRVTDQTGIKPEVGKRTLPASTIAFIQTLAQQFAAAKLPVTTMTLPAASAFEVDVNLQGKSFAIRTNLQVDPAEQAGAAVAVLNQLGSSTPGSYLDVRVPGRAYYH